MVHLVLEARREETIHLLLARRAVVVEPPRADAQRPDNVAEQLGDR